MPISRSLLRRTVRAAVLGVGVLLAVVWFLLLRPQALGGPAAYITVAGVSMEPTLHAGDLVIMTRAEAYEAGDVVAYRVPQGDAAAGRHVIHRVIGGGANGGYLLQGDNTPAPDRWRPTEDDMIGRQLVAVPRLGSVLMFLKQPAAIAGVAAALAVFALPHWSTTGNGAVGTRRRPSSALVDVVMVNQSVLVDSLPARPYAAQLLVEFRNVGTQWAEMSAAMSTYSTTRHDGSTTAQGRFTAVSPRRVAPGETGYMLADIADVGAHADELASVSTVLACRDARPWAPGAIHRPQWQLVTT